MSGCVLGHQEAGPPRTAYGFSRQVPLAKNAQLSFPKVTSTLRCRAGLTECSRLWVCLSACIFVEGG